MPGKKRRQEKHLHKWLVQALADPSLLDEGGAIPVPPAAAPSRISQCLQQHWAWITVSTLSVALLVSGVLHFRHRSFTVSDGVAESTGGELPIPSGQKLELDRDPEGAIFRLSDRSGKTLFQGGHGGVEEQLAGWYDESRATLVISVNNLDLPNGGFAVHVESLRSAKLLSAMFYPADNKRSLQKGVALAQPPEEQDPIVGTVVRYAPDARKWRYGGEWRLIYKYP